MLVKKTIKELRDLIKKTEREVGELMPRTNKTFVVYPGFVAPQDLKLRIEEDSAKLNDQLSELIELRGKLQNFKIALREANNQPVYGNLAVIDLIESIKQEQKFLEDLFVFNATRKVETTMNNQTGTNQTTESLYDPAAIKDLKRQIQERIELYQTEIDKANLTVTIDVEL